MFHARVRYTHVYNPEGGYLAVDLFFCLSGFVLSEAYAQRLDAGMSWMDFMWRRVLRLWPLYAVGIVLPLILTLYFAIRRGGALSPLLAEATELFFIPSIQGDLFPLNIPAWSLVYELIANLAMVLFWKRLSSRTLTAFLLLAGLALVWTTISHGSADAGGKAAQLPAALARVSFSFAAGLLVWRVRDQLPAAPAWIAFLLVLLALFIRAPDRAPLDLALILIGFPALIGLASRSEPGPWLLPMASLLGSTSYAVYVIHNGVLWPSAGELQKIAPRLPEWMSELLLVLEVLTIGLLLDPLDVWVRSRLSSRHRKIAASPLGVMAGRSDHHP